MKNTYRVQPEPTTAKPGTIQKLAVLQSRATMGVSLFHPDDVISMDGLTDMVSLLGQPRASARLAAHDTDGRPHRSTQYEDGP